MQSFALIKSPKTEHEESIDFLRTSRDGMPSQQFLFQIFQYAVRDTNKNKDLSTRFLIDTAATCSNTNCDTFTQIEEVQLLVVLPLEKSLLAANGYAMPMKGKVVTQSVLDGEYNWVFQHMVYVFTPPSHE